MAIVLTPVEIEFIKSMETTGGRLDPNTVVQRSRPVDAPTHNKFEWSDRKAAHQHRLQQAELIMRSFVVVIRTERPSKKDPEKMVIVPVQAPKYIRDVTKPHNEKGLRNIAEIRKDEDAARDTIIYASKQVIGHINRYKAILDALKVNRETEAAEPEFDPDLTEHVRKARQLLDSLISEINSIGNSGGRPIDLQ